MTEIQTSRNEAYQNQQPGAVPQNPIYEHIAWILSLVVVSVTLGFYIDLISVCTNNIIVKRYLLTISDNIMKSHTEHNQSMIAN